MGGSNCPLAEFNASCGGRLSRGLRLLTARETMGERRELRFRGSLAPGPAIWTDDNRSGTVAAYT